MSKLFKLKFTAGFTHTLTFTKQLCCAPLAHCKSKCRGFTLVETLVAISIFTVSLLGMMSVLGSSIANTGYAKQKMLATYLAQEGIEYVRNMRDTSVLYDKILFQNGSSQKGWSKFENNLNNCHDPNSGNACGFSKSVLPFNVFVCPASTNKCNLYVNDGGYESYNNNPIGTDSGFVRKIWMDTSGLSSDEVRISSNVSWTQSSGNYNITFSEILFNWVDISES